MKKQILLPSLLLGALTLTACSGVKEQVGLGRKSPDEFAVVERAPLSMPPGFELRPPMPGAPRPQDAARSETIAEKFGVTNAEAQSEGAAGLLTAAGATRADPDIRRKIDTESQGVVVKDQGFVDRLLNWNERQAPAPIVDADAEKARIKNADGKVTGDQAVVIERKKKAPLEGIF